MNSSLDIWSISMKYLHGNVEASGIKVQNSGNQSEFEKVGTESGQSRKARNGILRCTNLQRWGEDKEEEEEVALKVR